MGVTIPEMDKGQEPAWSGCSCAPMPPRRGRLLPRPKRCSSQALSALGGWYGSYVHNGPANASDPSRQLGISGGLFGGGAGGAGQHCRPRRHRSEADARAKGNPAPPGRSAHPGGAGTSAARPLEPGSPPGGDRSWRGRTGLARSSVSPPVRRHRGVIWPCSSGDTTAEPRRWRSATRGASTVPSDLHQHRYKRGHRRGPLSARMA